MHGGPHGATGGVRAPGWPAECHFRARHGGTRGLQAGALQGRRQAGTFVRSEGHERSLEARRLELLKNLVRHSTAAPAPQPESNVKGTCHAAINIAWLLDKEASLPIKLERERLNLNLRCGDPFEGVRDGLPQRGMHPAVSL